MRIVSWNIERGYHPHAIVKQLQDLKADVYLLYELDRGNKRTHGVDMFTMIKEGLGLAGEYVREFKEIDSVWRRIIPWGGPGGGEIGNAIFSRYSILNYHSIELPTQSPLIYQRTTLIPELFQPRLGCRQAQIFEIETECGRLTVASAHLELWRAGWKHRLKQLDTVIQQINSKNVILAGDFNNIGGALRASLLRDHGSGEVRHIRQWLKKQALTDPFDDIDTTCGRFGIKAKIDWIAGSATLKIEAVRLIHTALCDHSCLVVDYSMSG